MDLDASTRPHIRAFRPLSNLPTYQNGRKVERDASFRPLSNIPTYQNGRKV